MSGFSGLVGPGTQPSEEDGAEFAYMEMPKAMRTYSAPEAPEKEEAEAFRPALCEARRSAGRLARIASGWNDHRDCP